MKIEYFFIAILLISIFINRDFYSPVKYKTFFITNIFFVLSYFISIEPLKLTTYLKVIFFTVLIPLGFKNFIKDRVLAKNIIRYYVYINLFLSLSSIFLFTFFDVSILNSSVDFTHFRATTILNEPSHLTYTYIILIYIYYKFISSDILTLSTLMLINIYIINSLSFIILMAVVLYFLLQSYKKINIKQVYTCLILVFISVLLPNTNFKKNEKTYLKKRIVKVINKTDNSFMNRTIASFETLLIASPEQLFKGLGDTKKYTTINYSKYKYRKNNDFNTHNGLLQTILSLGALCIPIFFLILKKSTIDEVILLFATTFLYGGIYQAAFFLIIFIIINNKDTSFKMNNNTSEMA